MATVIFNFSDLSSKFQLARTCDSWETHHLTLTPLRYYNAPNFATSPGSCLENTCNRSFQLFEWIRLLPARADRHVASMLTLSGFSATPTLQRLCAWTPNKTVAALKPCTLSWVSVSLSWLLSSVPLSLSWPAGPPVWPPLPPSLWPTELPPSPPGEPAAQQHTHTHTRKTCIFYTDVNRNDLQLSLTLPQFQISLRDEWGSVRVRYSI